MEKMPNLAVDAEEQKNDANHDFQQSKAEEKNPKLNGNPKNIIISITALST